MDSTVFVNHGLNCQSFYNLESLNKIFNIIFSPFDYICKLPKSHSLLNSRKILPITTTFLIAALYFKLRAQNTSHIEVIDDDSSDEDDGISVASSLSSVSIDGSLDIVNSPTMGMTSAYPMAAFIANLQRTNKSLRSLAVCTKEVNEGLFFFYRSVIIFSFLTTHYQLNKIWRNACKANISNPPKIVSRL